MMTLQKILEKKKEKKSYMLEFIKSLRLKCWETPLDILPGRPKQCKINLKTY